MSSPVIRLATLADTDAITRVHINTWRNAYRGIIPQAILDNLSSNERTALWDRRIRDPDTTVLILTLNDRVVGFTSFGLCRDNDIPQKTTAEIYTIYLEPVMWGEGYGKLLYEAAENYLRRKRYHAVVLWVLQGNKRGSNFHEHMGFSPTGHRKSRHIADNVALPEIRYKKTLKYDELARDIEVSPDPEEVAGLPYTAEEKAVAYLIRDHQASQFGGKTPPLSKFNVTSVPGATLQQGWIPHEILAHAVQFSGAASPPKEPERQTQFQQQESDKDNQDYDYRLRHTAQPGGPSNAPRFTRH